jgi:hypothetical protein
MTLRMDSPFDPEVKTFVLDNVRSVWALELLLLLRRGRERAWTAKELTRRFPTTVSLVDSVLEQFRLFGLVRRDSAGARYEPAADFLDELCHKLEAAYRERPAAVRSLIGKQPDYVRSLAAAFRIIGPEE